jgi:hypothetical protein
MELVRYFVLLTDSEHLGAANRAYTLGRRLAVLHGDALGVLDFPLGAAFYTVRLHQAHLPVFGYQA